MKCTILTPMFVAGADARGRAEIRAPSIRGCLRYWLRAYLGAHLPLEQVREHEWDLMGGPAEEESGVRASRLTVSVTQRALPQRPYSRSEHGEGTNYLFWSMSSMGGNGDKRFLEPGGQFSIQLGFKGLTDASDQATLRHLGWLLAHFGALGSRATRCGGNMHIADGEVPLRFEAPASAAEYQAALSDGLRALHSAQPGWQSFDEPPEFDILHPRTCRIWVLNGSRDDHPGPYANAATAVNDIGKQMIGFRRGRSPDARNVFDWLNRSKSPQQATIERAIFGLPLPFRYANRGPADVLESDNSERRRSPLWLRIQQLSNGTFVGLAILFKSRFLPGREQLEFRRARIRLQPPDTFGLIEEFVTSRFDAREVKFA